MSNNTSIWKQVADDLTDKVGTVAKVTVVTAAVVTPVVGGGLALHEGMEIRQDIANQKNASDIQESEPLIHSGPQESAFDPEDPAP